MSILKAFSLAAFLFLPLTLGHAFAAADLGPDPCKKAPVHISCTAACRNKESSVCQACTERLEKKQSEVTAKYCECVANNNASELAQSNCQGIETKVNNKLQATIRWGNCIQQNLAMCPPGDMDCQKNALYQAYQGKSAGNCGSMPHVGHGIPTGGAMHNSEPDDAQKQFSPDGAAPTGI